MVKSVIVFLGFTFIGTLFISACGADQQPTKLPIYGERDVINGDTIYRSIPDFVFTDQDSQAVTNATFEGKIYIADFFFIHCPTICPKVKASAKRVYDHFAQDPRVMLLSHTIDVKHDTVAALKAYAQKIGIDHKKWRFVTGDHDGIYGIADDYFSVAKADSEAPGGFDHSGLLILVDKNRHVRASVDGTLPEDIPDFIKKVEQLLKEE